ncbi:tetratricopeptide repeat protein [bacterium]|nr:MAG: tetratricopeptide repeat protein [bacterium]
MQNKNSIVWVIVVVIVVIAAVGGYLLGSRSGDKNYSQGENVSASAPVNHAGIISDLNGKIKNNPKDTEALFTLADIYFDMKQFDTAAEYYKKVIAIKPDNADAYKEIGLALHYLGKSAEGLGYIEEGLKRNQYNQKMWLTKGFILAYGMNDLKGARLAWEKTKALDPESQGGKAAAEYLAKTPK